MGGQNISDTRSNATENMLNTSNVGQLAPHWTFQTHGDVSATPAVVDNAVYVPDWGGYVYKFAADTGKVIWSHQISEYDGVRGSISRTSPTVSGDTVYIGDQNGGHLIALKTSDGSERWSTRMDAFNSHPKAVLTQSPVVYNGVVYEGVSSSEESAAADPNYSCCTFGGSLDAVDATTGEIIWATSTVPPNNGAVGGYSGGAVLGGTPALDPSQNTVYITTGNNYSVPQSVLDCSGSVANCASPDDHFDSVLALDMSTGAVKWASRLQDTLDVWNDGCLAVTTPTNCPTTPGSDSDLASGPNLLTIKTGQGKPELVVGVGQKNGIYTLLDAATGKVLWRTTAGPGSAPGGSGGIMWGTATDGKRIYIAEANSASANFTLQNGTKITSGLFTALDPQTGKILWQTPDPSGNVDPGAVSTANGVVFAGSLSGHMYALDGANGKVLWDYKAAGSSNAGPAIANGNIYWGNGDSRLGSGSTTFYAFSRGGR
jgi:polyvinyl alcohol dehydrogenase (cytochrome)